MTNINSTETALETEQEDLMADPELQAQKTAQKVFTEADGLFWKGLKTNNFSYRRQAAADLLGLKFGRLTNAEQESWKTENHYPGLVHDVVLTVFLCVSSNEQVARAFDTTERKRLLAEMMDWAEGQDVAPPSDTFKEAFKFFIKAQTIPGFRKEPGKAGIIPKN